MRKKKHFLNFCKQISLSSRHPAVRHSTDGTAITALPRAGLEGLGRDEGGSKEVTETCDGGHREERSEEEGCLAAGGVRDLPRQCAREVKAHFHQTSSDDDSDLRSWRRLEGRGGEHIAAGATKRGGGVPTKAVSKKTNVMS
ncbi:hypothetical protein E2C01_094654 [Portunus trituberculatus]|uniref:Uncharacterized protein n=1 Tax=Portunus trituberculatus TaxID=210409 RepID=A0A5B7JSY5_PORTR|nr:hypothetical protein [Portunus trituberculatus]